MKILLLEDDKEIGGWVKDGLSRAGHVIDWLENGKDALVAATTQDYDIMILDRMTPELDGMSVLRAIRASKNMTPVLFLTARDDEIDRVLGFELGGDDYVTDVLVFSERLHTKNKHCVEA